LVWPGKPVNWAFKCSGAADAHQVIVTRRVFDQVIRDNEFLLRPCYHSGHWRWSWPSTGLWSFLEVKTLPDVQCFVRKDPWCPGAADEFCEALLEGETEQTAGDLRRFLYTLGLL